MQRAAGRKQKAILGFRARLRQHPASSKTEDRSSGSGQAARESKPQPARGTTTDSIVLRRAEPFRSGKNYRSDVGAKCGTDIDASAGAGDAVGAKPRERARAHGSHCAEKHVVEIADSHGLHRDTVTTVPEPISGPIGLVSVSRAHLRVSHAKL
jgi:hypothetical protein